MRMLEQALSGNSGQYSEPPPRKPDAEQQFDADEITDFVVGLVEQSRKVAQTALRIQDAAQAAKISVIPYAKKIVPVIRLALALHTALLPNTDSLQKRFDKEGGRILKETRLNNKKEMHGLTRAIAEEIRKSEPSLQAQVMDSARRLNERYTKNALRVVFRVLINNHKNVLNSSAEGTPPLMDDQSIEAFSRSILGPWAEKDNEEAERTMKGDDHNVIYDDKDFIRLANLLEVDWNAPRYKSYDIGH